MSSWDRVVPFAPFESMASDVLVDVVEALTTTAVLAERATHRPGPGPAMWAAYDRLDWARGAQVRALLVLRHRLEAAQ